MIEHFTYVMKDFDQYLLQDYGLSSDHIEDIMRNLSDMEIHNPKFIVPKGTDIRSSSLYGGMLTGRERELNKVLLYNVTV